MVLPVVFIYGTIVKAVKGHRNLGIRKKNVRIGLKMNSV
jgi:hypothetical protein